MKIGKKILNFILGKAQNEKNSICENQYDIDNGAKCKTLGEIKTEFDTLSHDKVILSQSDTNPQSIKMTLQNEDGISDPIIDDVTQQSYVKEDPSKVNITSPNYNNTSIERENGELYTTNIPMLYELNDKQREAALAVTGKVRVTAGAGSGKTKTLTTRYAYLVNEIGIDPAHILCLTFTNKAAKEMSQRIAKLVSHCNINDYVCTIHGFCVKVLRKEIYRLGFPKTYVILDEEDAKALAKQVIDELGLSRSVITIKQFLDGIGKSKAQSPYVKDFIDPNTKDKAKIEDKSDFALYLNKQLKFFALDFNDLIYFTLYILNEFPDAKEYWQNELHFVMVDEVQDCNVSNWGIINIITEKYQNLFIVGDPDQAIYEWRGAKPELFLKFQADKDVILNENYRSTDSILNIANSIIKNNQKRIPKELFTRKTSTTSIVHFHGDSEREEALWVVKQIKSLINQGKKKSDIAILYRASYLSRFIEQALMDQQIPYTIWGGIRFFERREIKDAISYLRLIDHNDDMAFVRIANVPSRKIGKVFMARLQAFAAKENNTLYETLKNHIKEKEFDKPSVIGFIDVIESCRQSQGVISITTLLDQVLKKSGLKDMIQIDDNEERLENLQELSNSIKYYEDINNEEDISLATYLQDVALYTNADYKKDSDVVKLMTIHQSKGLEFPCVFIIGLTEGIFPSYRSIRERKKDGEEEERRLMYVAVTRAEKNLFLTESEGYNYMSRQEKYPSRFLTEIKKEFFVTEGKMDDNLWNGTRDMIEELERELTPPLITASFEVGETVKHHVFGEGEIISIQNNGEYCSVSFNGKVYKINQAALYRDVLPHSQMK
jgi:DNA helicase II / ATP-dependent DNA helicase PcrA